MSECDIIISSLLFICKSTEKVLISNIIGENPYYQVKCEDVLILGKVTSLRRIFLVPPRDFQEYSPLLRVGWVFDLDIENCMICYVRFNIFNRRHHCRACGDIICSQCASVHVRIAKIGSRTLQRVCLRCYQGQVCEFVLHSCTHSCAKITKIQSSF